MYYEVESNADPRRVRFVAENPRTAIMDCIQKHGLRHKIIVRRVSVDLGSHKPTVHCERHGYPRDFMRALGHIRAVQVRKVGFRLRFERVFEAEVVE